MIGIGYSSIPGTFIKKPIRKENENEHINQDRE